MKGFLSKFACGCCIFVWLLFPSAVFTLLFLVDEPNTIVGQNFQEFSS